VIHELVADRFGDTIQNMIPRNVPIVAQDNADPINLFSNGCRRAHPASGSSTPVGDPGVAGSTFKIKGAAHRQRAPSP
jgi:hypothetical protein